MASLKRYMEYSRYKDVLSFKMVNQYQGSMTSSEIRAEDLFPRDPGIQALARGLFSYLFGFIHKFGEWASVFLGFYILGTFSTRVFNYAYRVFVLKEAHGFSKQLLLCCCPDILLFRKYREDYRASSLNQNQAGPVESGEQLGPAAVPTTFSFGDLQRQLGKADPGTPRMAEEKKTNLVNGGQER